MKQKRNVITGKERIEGITLKQFIEEKRLLKTKIKLLHILLLEQDIKELEREYLTLETLQLDDLYLTEGMHLIVPVADKIIPFERNNLRLSTYLVYLSYLYEIDLLTIYEEDPEFLWKILSKLQISGSIKANLYNLMKNNEGECFEKHLEELNSSLYRDSLREDKLLLQRSVKK